MCQLKYTEHKPLILAFTQQIQSSGSLSDILVDWNMAVLFYTEKYILYIKQTTFFKPPESPGQTHRVPLAFRKARLTLIGCTDPFL